MAKVTITGSGNGTVRIVDPNPEGTNIKYEDLMVYVKLKARTSSRSIITKNEGEEVIIEGKLYNNETNFTHPTGAKTLTTNWTKVGGGPIGEGNDNETFGITSVDIEVKSSFTPQVVINFIDIRGATLFEQGACSPYASFFKMPYPVFELTMKGFYGKAVTYTLALRKFNAKFNPSTGNFEVKCEFIGYTYAFLSDIVMGYALAAPNMIGGREKLESIWRDIAVNNSTLPSEPKTLRELIKDINEIENVLSELVNTNEFREVDNLKKAKEYLSDLEPTVTKFIKEVTDLNVGAIFETSSYQGVGKTKMLIPKDNFNEGLEALIENYFGSSNNNGYKGSLYGVKVILINDIETSLSDLKWFYTLSLSGLYDTSKIETKDNNVYRVVDFGEILLKGAQTHLKSLTDIITEKDKTLKGFVNDSVESTLGFNPTVKNVMLILTANVELFLELLVDASVRAENNHKGVPKPQKILGDGSSDVIYPWPEYYEDNSTQKGEGDVLTYPGDNSSYVGWEEVMFVEDYIKAYLELKVELDIDNGETSDIEGYSDYIPMNTLESPLFEQLTPNSYYNETDINNIISIIGQRSFMVGDHTFMNSLTAWRARLNIEDFSNTTLYDATSTARNNTIGDYVARPLSDIMNNTDTTFSTRWKRDLGFGGLTTTNIMDGYGFLDGMNCANTLLDETNLSAISERIKDESAFKAEIIKQLVIKEDKFSVWAKSEINNVTAAKILPALKQLGDTKITNDTKILSYDGPIELKNGINISPNPYKNDGDFFIVDGIETTPSITLKEETKGKVETTDLAKQTKDLGTYNDLTIFEKQHFYLELTEWDKSIFSFTKNESRVPTVSEDFKDKFMFFYDWKKENTNLDIGGVSVNSGAKDGERAGIIFPEPFTLKDSSIQNALFQTPLWSDNLPKDINSRYVDGSGMGIKRKNNGQELKGKQQNKGTSNQALAYLALITLGDWNSNGNGFAGWYDDYTTNQTTITPFFKFTASEVKMPKAMVLITGAVLWRMSESGYLENTSSTSNNIDPVKWVSGYLKDYKKFEPYHWPAITNGRTRKSKKTFDDKKLMSQFTFMKTGDSDNYVDIRQEMKGLVMMPSHVQKEFIDKFKNWVTSNWSTKGGYLESFDPIHFGTTNSITGYYGPSDETYEQLSPLTGKASSKLKNEGLEKMYNELYTEFYKIGFSTPKSFYGVYKDNFSKTFNLKEEEFNKFIDSWILGFQKTVKTRLTDIRTNPSTTSSKRIIEDSDIKLNLYRSFKSIYDKWLTRSDGSLKLFYNNTSNAGKSRRLIDHFKFVNRAFNDIGDKAVIDVTQLKQLAENPTMSMYQLTAQLLSRNNFDFFPLPSFINFGSDSVGTSELEQMFEPVTNLDNIETSPSFVCMFIGGTSRHLDISAPQKSMCGGTDYQYGNDGTSFKDDTSLASDLRGGDVTAFLIKYGTENQSHFTSVNLDQAEFKETQESLMVIDQLAKGGKPTDRASKGQNLYDIYQTRSYTCEVEALGNMMIQPMQYFELVNVPMFNGAYLITEVKHNMKPHYMTTTFKGTRVPRVVIPLVTDAFTSMSLPDTDLSKASNGSASDILKKLGDGTTTGSEVSRIESKPLSKEVVNNDGSKVVVKVAQQYKSEGKFKSKNVTTVVCHWTADWNFNINTKTSVGYHFVIDNNGDLYETNDINLISSHAGCPDTKTQACHSMNYKSVGVSYVGGLKFHQKLGVPGTVDGIHNFSGNRQDNTNKGYPLTKDEWKMDKLTLPYNQSNGNANTKTINPKKIWDSYVNAILLAKKAHPTITNITSHHWTSADKQDVRDTFPWAQLISDLRDRGFTEVRLVTKWLTTNGKGKGNAFYVYEGDTNLPANLFGPGNEEKQGNRS